MKRPKNKCENKVTCRWALHIKKVFVAAMIGTLGAGLISGSAGVYEVYAKNVSDTEFVVSDNWLEPAKIHVSEDSAVARRGTALPAVFDGRTKGWVSSVKDQGENETCWAFASIAAMEGNLIKNGKVDSSIDLSENQFAYFFYNRQTDRLGYTAGDYNINLIGDYLSGGGTLQGSGIALATWAGVTTEARSPYLTQPSSNLCYANDYSVKNVYCYPYGIGYLDYSVATIKQAVYDHGAVATGIYLEEGYYNYSNASYYYPISDGRGNHAVTIVGWDDSYPKENFNVTPSRNGAWIVKNSYGETFGEDGYNYVSYEDASLTEMMAFEVVTKAEQYDNNYQHDGSANPLFSTNAGEWYASVFTAKGAAGYNEELKAVSVYTLSTNTRYEVQVYTGLTDAGKPTSGTKVFSSTVKGALADAGYQTITLPKTVSLTAGEKFAVHVKLTDAYGNPAFVGADKSYWNNWIQFKAATGKNQSFGLVGGTWIDFGETQNANMRIKAFTDNTSVKSKFSLSDKTLTISKGESAKLSLKCSVANVYRTVTWKSSDKKIATVSSAGKIKGKTYGTVKISGTFVAADKKKTLTCKVTVGPSKVKGLKVSGGKKLKVKWKKNSAADGYEIYYATSKNGKYKKLSTISKNTKTSYNKKMKKATYYVKIRPYKKNGKQKLYGSFTAVKSAKIK